MDKQSYTQRVQALAEKMAIKHYIMHPDERPMKYIGHTWDELPDSQGKKLLIDLKKEDARIAVAERAEGFRQGWLMAVGDNPFERDQCEDALKELGLIPDNAPSGLQIGVLQPGEPGYGGYNPDNPPPPFCGQMCKTCGEESKTTSWRESHSAAMCDICYSKNAQEGGKS